MLALSEKSSKSGSKKHMMDNVCTKSNILGVVDGACTDVNKDDTLEVKELNVRKTSPVKRSLTE